MTTRPKSVRRNHKRARHGSLVTGIAAVTWVACGIALVVLTRAWWSWLFVVVGLTVACTLLILLPRLRRAKEQLDHVEKLRTDQQQAAQAQNVARMRAFGQPARRQMASR